MNRETKTRREKLLPWLAGALLLAALVRVIDPSLGLRVDTTTLWYLGVAAIVLIAPEITSIKVGKDGIEVARALDLAKEALATAKDAQSTAVGPGKKEAPKGLTFAPQRGEAKDDPWKGVFGGSSEVNGRRLTANVTGGSGLYTVDLQVESTDQLKRPLSGKVQFFLHDTFQNDRPVVTVNQDGVARLTLYAYGAFTAGASADNAETLLELDLSELPNAPKKFREN